MQHHRGGGGADVRGVEMHVTLWEKEKEGKEDGQIMTLIQSDETGTN